METIKKNIPGILLTLAIGMSGFFLNKIIPYVGGITLAIILGLIIGNIFKLNRRFEPGVKFSEKNILAYAIMLIGLNLNFNILTKLGYQSIAIIIFMVFTIILISLFVGKLVGISKSFSLLIGVGSAICGSSAIAAVAPMVTKQEEEVGISISVVNLLGILGIFFMPILALTLKFNDSLSGLMIGGTLQAVGHVVAAAFSLNDLVGEFATVVKMGRILMLGPVILLFGFFMRSGDTNRRSGKFILPNYLIGFIILSIVGTAQILPMELAGFLKLISKILLSTAMAAIGLKIRLESLFRQGPQALATGAVLFTIQIALMLGILFILF